MFKCEKCGRCCENLNKNDIYSHLHLGDGICIYYDKTYNKCSIYNNRPDICNIEKAYKKYFYNVYSKKDYYELNYKGCENLMAKDSKEKKINNDIIIGVAQKEITQKHGEATSQIIQTFKGKRYDSNGLEIIHKGRNLEEISKSKINNNYEYSNIKQQSGFSAELIKESRDNKNFILNEEQTRTRTTDGIGKTNDQKYDHIKVGENKNTIIGSESQMKFKGRFSTPEEVRISSENIVKDMVSDKWERYSDRPMDIPSEQVEYAKTFAKKEAENLRINAEKFRNKGDFEKAKLLDKKAERYELAEKNIRDSGVSSKEAWEARVNPKKFVNKEILRDSHNAGLEAAKGAFILSGTISGAQNIYAVLFEDKPLDEAILEVTISTGTSSAVAYGIGNAGTIIKSTMHTSKNSLLRSLGKTNAPAMIATGILEVGKSLYKYSTGEISEEELLEELGEKGTGMVAASYGSAIGTAILPGIGTLIGGMIGYTISSLLYKESLSILKNVRISEERRKIIETINEEAIREIRNYKEKIKKESKEEYLKRERIFNGIFEDINLSIFNNNIDAFFSGINKLGKEFDIEFQFKTFKEFDDFMNDETSILKL